MHWSSAVLGRRGAGGADAVVQPLDGAVADIATAQIQLLAGGIDDVKTDENVDDVAIGALDGPGNGLGSWRLWQRRM
jgi:hypothetical protein